MEDRYEMKTKVWAHRGASAYAPENTLEAFLLAAEQGADGVELDVQLTKDGEMVVVHDEEIDRVSDGSGFVKDYTLAELKNLNFNKTHPEYQNVKIPTLREVYEALKPTGMTINVELKTAHDGEMVPKLLLMVLHAPIFREHTVHDSDDGFSTMLALVAVFQLHTVVYHLLNLASILWHNEFLSLRIVI